MDSLIQLIKGEHHNPFEFLSWQREENYWKLRVFVPEADEVYVLNLENKNKEYKLDKKFKEGLFEKDFENKFFYKLKIKYRNNLVKEEFDPYYFYPNFLTDYDIYLFNKGENYEIYKKLGAVKIEINGITGYHFSVWSPNAIRVSVVGDFNNWDGRRHPMKVIGTSGIWVLFLPEIPDGSFYKFEIKTKNKEIFLKSDPYGKYFEKRPKNSSITYTLSYKWNDTEWKEKLKNKNIYEEPMAIYELHLGSWKRKNGEFLNYREIGEELVPYLKELNFNWVEFLPICEHPLDSSWGYQITGYFAPTSRYGTPEDFCYLVDYLHKNNIGVIIDWSPAHFPKDSFSLYYFDGTHLYEHSHPYKRDHPDWHTAIFNYGRYEVKNFLISSALNWLDNYHIDGIRCDAIASILYLDYSRKEGEWIPNIYGGKENLEGIEFLKELNRVIYEKFPHSFTIAEESTAWPGVSKPVYLGGLGFGFKWNMGWMHDILFYFSLDPIYRKYHHNCLTFALLYAFFENFILPISHDELTYGKKSLYSKMPGNSEEKLSNLRAFLTYMYGHPGKKLIFMGTEFADENEWDFNREISWYLLEKEENRKILKFIKDLNHLYISEKAFHQIDFSPDGFQWIDFSDYEKSIVSFIRKGKDKNDILIFVFNFTPVIRKDYRIGVPFDCEYMEIFNSDSIYYGGKNIGNSGKVKAENIPFHNFPFSINITLPGLSGLIFKPVVDRII
jgi:1,4-alpha-glucan branching enzyme